MTTAAINPNKALWEKGDFTRLARTMRDSGTALVAELGVTPAMEVLDLGCGDGTTALPAARLGAQVLGIDIASNLVAAGNVRARAEGLTNIHFQEGDACALTDLANDRFDLVVSVFGAMFAPRPDDVAREMVRVTRPGGRIVMGNWIPGDTTLVAQVLAISSAYTPPPPAGFVTPMLWGVEQEVIDRFTRAGIASGAVTCQRRTYSFTYPGPPSAFLDEFLHFYGPSMNALEAAEKDGRGDAFKRELRDLFERQNTSGMADVSAMPATFLLVTVKVD